MSITILPIKRSNYLKYYDELDHAQPVVISLNLWLNTLSVGALPYNKKDVSSTEFFGLCRNYTVGRYQEEDFAIIFRAIMPYAEQINAGCVKTDDTDKPFAKLNKDAIDAEEKILHFIKYYRPKEIIVLSSKEICADLSEWAFLSKYWHKNITTTAEIIKDEFNNNYCYVTLTSIKKAIIKNLLLGFQNTNEACSLTLEQFNCLRETIKISDDECEEYIQYRYHP